MLIRFSVVFFILSLSFLLIRNHHLICSHVKLNEASVPSKRSLSSDGIYVVSIDTQSEYVKTLAVKYFEANFNRAVRLNAKNKNWETSMIVHHIRNKEIHSMKMQTQNSISGSSKFDFAYAKNDGQSQKAITPISSSLRNSPTLAAPTSNQNLYPTFFFTDAEIIYLVHQGRCIL